MTTFPTSPNAILCRLKRVSRFKQKITGLCLLHFQVEEKSISVCEIAKEKIHILSMWIIASPQLCSFGSVSQKKHSHIIIDTQDSSCVAKERFKKTREGCGTRYWSRIPHSSSSHRNVNPDSLPFPSQGNHGYLPNHQGNQEKEIFSAAWLQHSKKIGVEV